MIAISNRQRAASAGVLILAAYSMLTYDITKNIPWGVVADLVSGLSVIGIAVLMYPIFDSTGNKLMNRAYLLCRIIEGVLMLIGGAVLLSPVSECYRSLIYRDIHLYFFISGALFFYTLLLRSMAVPKFISQWGITATITLLIITIIKLLGFKPAFLDILLLPMVANEIFLAFYLIVKGFDGRHA